VITIAVLKVLGVLNFLLIKVQIEVFRCVLNYVLNNKEVLCDSLHYHQREQVSMH
jgi:hypothetical protein